VADAAAAAAGGAAAVAFLVVAAAVEGAAVGVSRGAAAAAVFRGLVEEISPGEVSVAPLGRGTLPAAAEAVVWLIPETPAPVIELRASD
jgi:hypothetical protein